MLTSLRSQKLITVVISTILIICSITSLIMLTTNVFSVLHLTKVSGTTCDDRTNKANIHDLCNCRASQKSSLGTQEYKLNSFCNHLEAEIYLISTSCQSITALPESQRVFLTIKKNNTFCKSIPKLKKVFCSR